VKNKLIQQLELQSQQVSKLAHMPTSLIFSAC